MLVQVKEVVPGREAKCLCVPVARRRYLLEVAHKSLVGGHFFHNRMAECLVAHYTRPGLRAQVYCTTSVVLFQLIRAWSVICKSLLNSTY